MRAGAGAFALRGLRKGDSRNKKSGKKRRGYFSASFRPGNQDFFKNPIFAGVKIKHKIALSDKASIQRRALLGNRQKKLSIEINQIGNDKIGLFHKKRLYRF